MDEAERRLFTLSNTAALLLFSEHGNPPTLRPWEVEMAIIDVEVYPPEEVGPGKFAQAIFLVHGHDDVLWTDDLDVATDYVRECLVVLTKGA